MRGAHDVDPGVVDPTRQLPGAARGLGGALVRLPVRDVASQWDTAVSERTCHLGERGLVDVDTDDRLSAAAQPLADRPANALRRSSDDNDTAHMVNPPFARMIKSAIHAPSWAASGSIAGKPPSDSPRADRGRDVDREAEIRLRVAKTCQER